MRYTAVATVTLGAGAIVGLSKDQVAPRKHALRASDREGFYETLAPIQLKAGEQFACDDKLPKGMADVLEDARETAERAKREKAEKSKDLAALREQLAAAQARIADLEGQLTKAEERATAAEAALVEAGKPATA